VSSNKQNTLLKVQLCIS